MPRRKSVRENSLRTIARESFSGGSFADVYGILPQVWKNVHREMLENWMRGGTMVRLEMEDDSDEWRTGDAS